MAFGGSMFCGLNLLRNGTEEQKRHLLPKLLAGDIRMTISISEPDAGSDVGAMRTQARRDGDHYVINGQKIWQTGAGAKNNFINVYAKTDPKAHYRAGHVAVPGRRTTRPDSKFASSTCSGGASSAHTNCSSTTCGCRPIIWSAARTRAGTVSCPACSPSAYLRLPAIAAARAASSRLALQYASERKQFGRAIGTFQAIAHMLADMQTEIEAAWSLTLRAASLVAAGKDALREITMAKLFASETYVKAANTGMQIFGGFGYSMEFDMQRHYRDARAATIAAGTSQIQRNLLAGLMGLKV